MRAPCKFNNTFFWEKILKIVTLAYFCTSSHTCHQGINRVRNASPVAALLRVALHLTELRCKVEL